MYDINSHTALIKMPTWKHKQLNDNERKNFVDVYNQTEKKYPIFLWMKKSSTTMFMWFMYVMLFGLISFFVNDEVSLAKKFLLIVCGVYSLQCVFEPTHMNAHSLFLEYDQLRLNNPRLDEFPIFFYAHYHHHHHRNDDWEKRLSYNDPLCRYIFDHEGTRNVIASHWHGFSLISSMRILLVVALIIYDSKYALYLWGYELGVLMLPLAHGWQHIDKKRYGTILGGLMSLLEKLKLVASKEDHDFHHVHTTPEVYQDFTSSGFLYSKTKDKIMNFIWKKAFHTKNKRPYDWLNYKVKAYVLFILAGVPQLLL